MKENMQEKISVVALVIPASIDICGSLDTSERVYYILPEGHTLPEGYYHGNSRNSLTKWLHHRCMPKQLVDSFYKALLDDELMSDDEEKAYWDAYAAAPPVRFCELEIVEHRISSHVEIINLQNQGKIIGCVATMNP